MGIVAWLVMGLLAGWIASLLVNKQGEGMLMDIVLGVVGAVVGGFIAHFAGFSGITGFNLYSILIAIGGAVVVLLVYHALARRASLINQRSFRMHIHYKTRSSDLWDFYKTFPTRLAAATSKDCRPDRQISTTPIRPTSSTCKR